MNALNLFEANIVYWIQENLRFSLMTPVMQAITTLGDKGIFWIVLTVLLLLFKKTRRAGICCALALILNLLAVNITIKPLIARERPYSVIEAIHILTHQPGDHSFPSGHTASSFACAWAFFRSMKSKWGKWALVLAALIGLSRLYVGVHYPSDVISGLIIGILMGALGVYLGNRIMDALQKRKKT